MFDTLTLVAAEDAKDKSPGCGNPDIDISGLALPVPTLRDDKEALRKRFGAAPDQGMVRYAHEGKNAESTITEQSLVYRLREGRIGGVAFS
ncbi:hypothetical protein GHK50_32475 [Sinorhizobium medicae]|uniref:Uncharacterized protein n=1 Tax=Sinorhizobium medicae TaxID=110321 RepID=A0A6G1WS48_9HYPH|nr:hypothetical protein [Sinorhizobium medicae]MQV98464.1 hypothetical protein [Sinorhizobium medicae]MQW72435.1 hypothetical protein [Sinorhizobium medicae]MQX87577.1 hypothetical protein [Sinorhizobium medicae]MQX97500.1 hypothetical protein [Sinorhizobium medicae]RVJ47928.1 hypothetical protein CN166_33010 [Sinorhizobium medicae]